ncbi:phosphotransferase [Paenibacillus antarcticus]|uniref:Aminoglycoside phosphotransferase n=1 Tax=Paenibacillus antarcticus TaxID=253703 RepID=A0A168PXW3_9BACL|nr:phosphotransferase [Paenibacillus antarcticus]OAB47174.1 aminoglycoside phosphotransferase [Paenibacillus antarcticus]
MKIGELIGIGNTAKVYRWGKTEVIKLFYDQSSAVNEGNNAELINNLKLRTPKYSGLVEHEGKMGIVYERIDGPTMLWHIEPSERSLSYNAKIMANLQCEIHNVENKILPNLKSEITNKVNNSHEISNDEKQIIIDMLKSLPDGNSLCHYDFHPDNIIISPNGPIIIDWLNLLVGSHEADITRTSMMIQSHSLPPNAPNWLIHRDLREFFNKEYLTEYMKLTDTNEGFLERWMIPTLAARIDEMQGEYRQEIKDKLHIRLRK